MWCTICNHEFPVDCTCKDRDQRLASLGEHPNIAVTYCSGCGEHATMCKCPEPKPERELRSEGKIIPDPRR